MVMFMKGTSGQKDHMDKEHSNKPMVIITLVSESLENGMVKASKSGVVKMDRGMNLKGNDTKTYHRRSAPSNMQMGRNTSGIGLMGKGTGMESIDEKE